MPAQLAEGGAGAGGGAQYFCGALQQVDAGAGLWRAGGLSGAGQRGMEQAGASSQRCQNVVLCGPCRLCKDVEAARAEANDNSQFLRPLRRLFEKLNVMDDFPVRLGGWGSSFG